MSDLKEQGFCTKILFQFEKNLYRKFRNDERSFGGYTVERINVFEWFSKLINRITLLEHAEIRDVRRRAKQMKVWIELRNLSSKKRRNTIPEVANM